MYRIDDDKSAIREVQKYLHFVREKKYRSIPPISIDGIYGEETKEAILAYQSIAGLAESGTVDFDTFTAIYMDFAEISALESEHGFLVEYELFPFKYGDSGKSVAIINMMLDDLKTHYPDLPPVRQNEFYSKDTEAAVEFARELYLMSGEQNEFDLALYNRIKYELTHS